LHQDPHRAALHPPRREPHRTDVVRQASPAPGWATTPPQWRPARLRPCCPPRSVRPPPHHDGVAPPLRTMTISDSAGSGRGGWSSPRHSGTQLYSVSSGGPEARRASAAEGRAAVGGGWTDRRTASNSTARSESSWASPATSSRRIDCQRVAKRLARQTVSAFVELKDAPPHERVHASRPVARCSNRARARPAPAPSPRSQR